MIDTLPNPKDVRDLLGDLLGRDVTINVIDPWAPLPTDKPCAAEYVDDIGRLRAICLVDLPLAVFLGAAIGLIPAGGAQDMVADGDPSAMVLTNLAEVLNILSALLNVEQNAHVKLGVVHPPDSVFPHPVAEISRALNGRLDLQVAIASYGTGRVSLISN